MKDKLFKQIQTTFLVIVFLIAVVALFLAPVVRDFLYEIENKTFDIRQKILADFKSPNEDIVILAVDDASYEYIVSTYGAWPVPRDFWANISKEIEKQNPKAIVFDLLFVQNFRAYGNADKKLTDVVRANDNIYLSMNFDNQHPEIRFPVDLPEKLAINVYGNLDNLKKDTGIKYTNVRPILKSLMDSTGNIGFINVPRDQDGIIRGYYPIFAYKDKFYKHLTLKVGLDLIGADAKNLKYNNSALILSDGRKIPLDEENKTYLNWYGDAGTYEYIPLWQADKAVKKGDKAYLKDKFQNKIIYVGTTATSLADIKSSPISRRLPGVETHTTMLNNILDNNFIKKTPLVLDVLMAIILVAMTWLCALRVKSVVKNIVCILGIVLLYSLFALFLMAKFNLWIGVILPTGSVILTFTVAYVIKYIITSRDYEHTYKLAVTDGLTEMYNHRYFQEQMKNNIENSKRYGAPFSLIMVDIDFFKKFNDKYGHQSGDAVLRQVAQTIKKNIRSTDIPCRYGGEEMSVILTNTKKEEAALVAQKICEAVRNREFELATGDWTHVTISLGVASMPEDGKEPQELIEYADRCLYIAKENGRNQVVSRVE